MSTSTYDAMQAAARAVVDAVDQRVVSLTAANEAAARDLAAAVAETRRVTAALEEVRGELEHLQDEHAGLQQENADLLGALGDVQGQRAALEAKVAALEAEVAVLRARIDELDPPVTPRDPIAHPYASTSFLNLARPIDAVLGTTDHPMAVSLRSVKGGFNRTTFTTPINVAGDDQRPLYIQEVPEGAWRPSSSDVRHEIPWAPATITIAGDMTAYPPAYNADGSLSFPTAPAGTKPDGFFSVINPANGQAIQSYKTCWGPDGPTGRTLIARRGTVKAYDLRGDVLDVQGFRASRLDGIGGLIRNGELEDGIHHMLYLGVRKEQLQAISGDATGFVPPARGRDSAGGYTGTIPLGQQFFIRPEVDVAALGLSPGGLILARCLQEYGAMPVDTAGWTVLYFEQGPLTSYYDAAKSDWQTKLLPLLVPRLDPVTWDNLTTGARVRPAAAPLA